MKNERVFISGGAGVIGSELTKRLFDLGAEILVGDLKPRPKIFPTTVKYRQGDLNTISLQELSQFSPTIFIHLAATFERSTETYEFWEHNFWHNVRLSHHLMTCLKDLPCLKRVVFASSYLIYDPDLYTFDVPAMEAARLSEDMPIAPRNLTGMAKLAHEIELRFLNEFRSEQFTSVSARIFRGYGRNSRDIISRWVRSALRGETLTVFRPEGMFDYIYAADTAEGLIRIAELPSLCGVINLGTGRPRRVSEVIDVIKANFPDVKIEHKDDVDINYEASCADTSSLYDKISWTPVYDLEKAIPEIIDFEKHQLSKTKNKYRNNILISSASRKIPLARSIIEAKKRLANDSSLYAGDVDKTALAQFVCDGFIELPKTTEDNINNFLEIIEKHDIGLVVPTRDGELEFWSKNKNLFESRGTFVLVSENQAIATSVDKLAFSEFGKEKKYPIIPAWERPMGSGPFVVKERYGAGSRSIGLNLQEEDARAHAQSLSHPIYQPFIEGREISVDAWLDCKHQVKGLVLRERNEVSNGESVITTTFRNPALESVCKELLESLPLRGPVVLQLIIDKTGLPHIIELNARFGGASTASIAAGLDIWYWTLLEMDGQNLDLIPFQRSEKEIRQIRMQQDIVLYDPDF